MGIALRTVCIVFCALCSFYSLVALQRTGALRQSSFSRDDDRVYNDGPGSKIRLKANNSLLGPDDFPFYPSTVTVLGQAYAAL